MTPKAEVDRPKKQTEPVEWWRHAERETVEPTSTIAKHRALLEQQLHFDQNTWLIKHAKQPCFQFSGLQKRMLRQWFNALDSDGSGTISIEELEDPMLSIGIVNDTHEIREMVNKLDKDSNGQIDFQEFVDFLTPHTRHKTNLRPHKYEVMFHRLTKKMEHQSLGSLDINTQLSMERRRFILESITSFKSQSIEEDLAELKKSKEEKSPRFNKLTSPKRLKHRRGMAKKAKLAALTLRHQEETRFQALEKVFLRNRALKRLEALPSSMLLTPVTSSRAQRRQLPPLSVIERSTVVKSTSSNNLKAQGASANLHRLKDTGSDSAEKHARSVPNLP